ncbi:MAG: tetratricopeptide repeat protein, partial [Candidatus Thorarchaeota archaeon]
MNFADTLHKIRTNNYSEEAVNEFLSVYVNYIVRITPDIEELVEIIYDFKKAELITEYTENKHLNTISHFMTHLEKYETAFNLLIKNVDIEKNDNYLNYANLVSLSGLLIAYDPGKNKKQFLIKLFKQVIEKSTFSNKYLKYAISIQANLAIQNENYQEKITEMEKLLPIAELNYFTEVLGAIYDKLGELYMEKGLIDKAKIYFDKALDLSSDISYEFGDAITAHKAGKMCLRNGDFNSAEKYFEEAMRCSTIENCAREYIDSAMNLAFIKNMQGKTIESEKLFEEILRRAEILKDYNSQFTIICNIGFSNLYNGNFNEFTKRMIDAKKLDIKLKLYDDEKAFIDLGIILGKSQLKTSLISEIIKYKEQYSLVNFRKEIHQIINYFFLSKADITTEVFDLLEFMIKGIIKRGQASEYINDLLIRITFDRKLDLDIFIKNKKLIKLLDILRTNFKIGNQYHFVLSFLTGIKTDYSNYNIMDFRKIFGMIEFKQILNILAGIVIRDNDNALSQFLFLSSEILDDFVEKNEKSFDKKLHLYVMKMISNKEIGDLDKALEIANKISEILNKEFEPNLENLVVYLEELSIIYYQLEQFSNAIEKITPIYEKYHLKMSPNQEAIVLLALGENYYRLENFSEVKSIIDKLNNYSLSIEKTNHLISLEIRYDIKIGNFLKAQERINKSIFNIEKKSVKEKSRILYNIYEYILSKELDINDISIIEFLLKNYKSDAKINLILQLASLNKILTYYLKENETKKVANLANSIIKYCYKLDVKEASKPFYLFLIKIYQDNSSKLYEIMEKIRELNEKISLIDFHIYDLFLYQLMNEKNIEKSIDTLYKLLDILLKINDHEIRLIKNKEWIGFFSALAILSFYPELLNKRNKIKYKIITLKKKLNNCVRIIAAPYNNGFSYGNN